MATQTRIFVHSQAKLKNSHVYFLMSVLTGVLMDFDGISM